ncbi:MAG: hypothetical protein ACRBM6_30200 [Geminicoccales bacterium]
MNTFDFALMAVVDGNCEPELLIFSYRIELGDCTLFIVANGYGCYIDTAVATHEKLGGAMGKHIPNETHLVGDPDRQHAARIGERACTMLPTK